MTLKRTGLAKMSAKRRAERAAAGDLHPSSTFRPGVPKVASRPAAKRPTDTGPDRATVDLVLERDMHSCSRCGMGVGAERGLDWSCQHRRARGDGGSSLSDTNLTGNLTVLCGSATSPHCHHEVERHRSEDRVAGYWMPQMTNGEPTDPTVVPMFHAAYGWVLLDNAGGFERIAQVAA